jgi:hypothetical protein
MPNVSVAKTEGNSLKPSLGARLLDALTPPLGPEAGAEQRRECRTTAVFILIVATIIFGFSRLNAKLGNTIPAVVELIITFILLLTLVAIRKGYVKLGAHIAILSTSTTIYFAMWYGGGMAAAAVVFLPMLPAAGLLSIGRSGGFAGAVQALGIVLLVAGAEKLGFKPHPEAAEKLFIKRTAEAVVVILQIWALCRAFFNLKDEAFGLLSASRDEIASLLNNMRQGVLAFGNDGRVAGRYSEQAKLVFGRETLDGAKVLELLYGGVPEYDLERQHFAAWLESLPRIDRASWEELAQLAPIRCVRSEASHDEQHLRLEFRPIFEHDKLSKVMLLVTDETENVRLKRTASAEKAARERMVNRMRRLAASGAHTFLEFLQSAQSRIEELQKTFIEASTLRVGELDYSFRQAHTIKGEARVYDLDELEKLMNGAEETFKHLREASRDKVSVSSDVSAQLSELFTSALAEVQHARRNLVAASPIGAAILDQVTVSRSDLAALRERVSVMQQRLGDAVSPLADVAARLASRPFGESTSGLVDGVQRWAEQRGKRAAVNINGKEIPIAPELADVLPGVLTHLTRNAVAHGVESPDERARAGKSEVGLIRLECAEHPEGPTILVEDDGAGVDLEGLEERAKALSVSESDPLELMFVNGLSTSPSTDALSGRGVGMAAVREALTKVGYGIEITTERGRGTRLTLKPIARLRPRHEIRRAG